MAVTNAFEYAVPSPYDASFENDERAIGVAATIGGAAGRTIFHLSKWFDLEGGQYTLKVVADDAATVFIGPTQGNMKTVGSVALSAGVTYLSAYIPRGRQRMDVLLTNLSTGSTPCYFAFSLWLNDKVVYSSEGDGWVFDTATIPDASVPSPGDKVLTYPVFSVLPDWRDGITERLEWNTQVLSSETDIEQRRALRRYPRRSIEASFVDTNVRRSRLNNFGMAALNRPILVPLWFEQWKLTDTLGTAIVFPEGTLVMRDFTAGEYVLAMDTDPANYEILKIESVNHSTDTLTFVEGPTKTWEKGSRVMPLRVAVVRESPTLENVTDRAGTTRIRFMLDEPCKWPSGAWGYCVPVFDFKFNRGDSLSMQWEQTVFVLDNDTGLVDITNPSNRTRAVSRVPLTLIGREKVYSLRQFMAQSRGRLERFWFPSLTSDVHPVGNFSGGFMDAKNSGAVDYFRTQPETRMMIAVVFKDRRPNVYRRVSDIVESFSGERYYFETDVPPITLSEVERVMFVMPVRFDQDAFELHHLVDGSAAVKSTVVLRSTSIEDLEDIECTITSRPYPLYSVDEVNVSVSIVGGQLRVFGYLPESIDPSATIVDGALISTLETYSIPSEMLNVGLGLPVGELRTILLTYAMLPEMLNVNVGITAGSLTVYLINYLNWPAEKLDVAVNIVGGSLS